MWFVRLQRRLAGKNSPLSYLPKVKTGFKKYLLPLVLVYLGLILKSIYLIMGAEIAPNAMLIESFGFLTICHFLVALGISVAIVAYVFSVIIKFWTRPSR